MTPDEWARVREIFDEALARGPNDRRAFLDEACAGNPARRREVGSLLDAHDTAGDFIEAPAYQIAADWLLDNDGDSLAGRVVGPYIVRHEIGRGGMGVVYLADDTRLSRRVALKAIAPGMGAEAGRRERMRQEARAAAALSHPGIATVYALEEIDSELYLACEYVPGPTLRALIAAGPLPPEEVLDIAAQLARALAAAHAQGVVHRDVKPENLVKNAAGVIKILDFGVAWMENASGSRLTIDGAAIGTPGYMSPEQMRHETVDFRSDVFSFGLVVREMAAGTNLSEAEPGLERIVAACLRERPEDRYQSTQALVRDLELLERGAAPSARPRGDEQGVSPAVSPAVSPTDTLTPRWWWECHQIAASVVYALMLYPAWRARVWLPKPWDSLFFFLALGAAATGVTVRLHLFFTARSYSDELSVQRARALPWTRWSDAAFSIALFLGALAIGGDHSEIAALLLSVSIAAAVASWMIEPVTTRAAFPEPKNRVIE